MDQTVTANIKRHLESTGPGGERAARQLMHILNIKKEAAYHRLNGQCAYTIGDVVRLSRKLQIPMNELTENVKPTAVQPSERILAAMEEYRLFLSRNIENYPMTVMRTLLQPDIFMALRRPNLFRFLLFTLNHRAHPVSFDDYRVDDAVEAKRQALLNMQLTACNGETFISETIIEDMSPDIFYYHDCGMISDANILTLCDELSTMVDALEDKLCLVTDSEDNSMLYYLPQRGLCQDTIALRINGCTLLFYREYDGCHVCRKSLQDRAHYLHWFENMKKYSMQITNFNEKQRIEFIARQRRALDSIADFAPYPPTFRRNYVCGTRT
jgi:hypothetical protein